MKIAHTLKFCTYFAIFSGLLTVSVPTLSANAHTSARLIVKSPVAVPTAGLKTESELGTLTDTDIDCDGDGVSNDARIDFDGDGLADSCVASPADIPEPPFEQSYIPSSADFYALLPEVGSSTRYECGDRLYEVTLSRPTTDRLSFSSGNLTLFSDITYDDIDPNLNQPLVVKDPDDGLRYSFDQEKDGEFYEYILTNYNGSVGFYAYQTGEQIVAVPCSPTETS